MDKVKIKFAKVYENAVIPSKRDEDAGYDCFPCFEEDYLIIEALETKFVPLGIASAISEDYQFILKERGSTGSKGLAVRAGVIDSGFRNQWLLPITNLSNKRFIIAKKPEEFNADENLVFSYEKAICQAILLPVPKTEVEEISYEDLQKIASLRGLDMLGSTDK